MNYATSWVTQQSLKSPKNKNKTQNNKHQWLYDLLLVPDSPSPKQTLVLMQSEIRLKSHCDM